MDKIIRTANLAVLKAWLIGGQTDKSGGHSEGFNTFSEYRNELKNNKGQYDFQKVQENINDLIEMYGSYQDASEDGFKNEGFIYWEEKYRFKFPSSKNLNILTKRIIKELNARDHSDNE